MITKNTKPKDHHVVPNEATLVAAPDFVYRCTVCSDRIVWDVDFGGWMHASMIEGADGRVSMWAPDLDRYTGV